MSDQEKQEKQTTAYEQLSDKERLFVDLYLACAMNATAACRRMGYRDPMKQGYRMSNNVQVQKAIRERLSAAAMEADEVLHRLKLIAIADIAAAYSIVEVEDVVDGKNKRLATVDLVQLIENGQSHLVKSVSWTQYGPRIVMHDSVRALELLGQHHGLFKQALDITSGGEPIAAVEVVIHDGRAKAEN